MNHPTVDEQIDKMEAAFRRLLRSRYSIRANRAKDLEYVQQNMLEELFSRHLQLLSQREVFRFRVLNEFIHAYKSGLPLNEVMDQLANHRKWAVDTIIQTLRRIADHWNMVNVEGYDVREVFELPTIKALLEPGERDLQENLDLLKTAAEFGVLGAILAARPYYSHDQLMMIEASRQQGTATSSGFPIERADGEWTPELHTETLFETNRRSILKWFVELKCVEMAICYLLRLMHPDAEANDSDTEFSYRLIGKHEVADVEAMLEAGGMLSGTMKSPSEVWEVVSRLKCTLKPADFMRLVEAMFQCKYFEGVSKKQAMPALAELFSVDLGNGWSSTHSKNLRASEAKNKMIFREMGKALIAHKNFLEAEAARRENSEKA